MEKYTAVNLFFLLMIIALTPFYISYSNQEKQELMQCERVFNYNIVFFSNANLNAFYKKENGKCCSYELNDAADLEYQCRMI